MNATRGKGWLDAGARVARVMIADPKVRSDLDTVTRHVDADEAPGFVRALLWSDTAVTASVLSTMPKLINAAIEGVGEVGAQVRGLPPGLVHATVDDLVGRIRFRRLGEAVGHGAASLAGWVRQRQPGPEDAVAQFLDGMAGAIREAGFEPLDALEVVLECAACRCERVVRRDPEAFSRARNTVRRVVERHPDLVEAVRGDRVGGAS